MPMLETEVLGETEVAPTDTVTDHSTLVFYRRRNPRLQSGSRPASFPGPLRSRSFTTGSTGPEGPEGRPPLVLKPPRQHSIADDDVVPVDGFMYRHLSQDLTNVKTMLHKLKRVIQEVSQFHLFVCILNIETTK